MSAKLNLQGHRFGKLTVITEANKTKHGKIQWECSCDCGRNKTVIGSNLVNGGSTSCGTCYKIPELLGKKFNDLTVIKFLGVGKNSRTKNVAYWLCEDSRGFRKKIRTAELLSNVRTSSARPTSSKDRQFSHRYSQYKKSAKDSNREFTMPYKIFVKMIQAPCHYCGAIGGHSHIRKLKYNGIDRIDSNKGYSIDNIVTSCYTCNRAKSNMKYDEFIKWINNLINFKKDN